MILRVGVLNNFNFSKKEMKQLEGYKGMNIFVNSNSFTKIKRGVKSIVTINPYMSFYMSSHSEIEDVSAFRIKVVGNAKQVYKDEETKCLNYCELTGKPALITFMRFISKESMNKYSDTPDNYVFKKGYYYYKHDLKVKLINKLKKTWGKMIKVCDLEEKGCPNCMNCSKLTFNTTTEPIYGINLSSSGYCPYNCPDCFAKRLITLNKNRLSFDILKQNNKMKGYPKILKKKNKKTPTKLTKKTPEKKTEKVEKNIKKFYF